MRGMTMTQRHRFVVLAGPRNTFYEGIPKLVVDNSTLCLTAGDEELVLDIDEVLRLFDHLDVCIHDAVLGLLWGS